MKSVFKGKFKFWMEKILPRILFQRLVQWKRDAVMACKKQRLRGFTQPRYAILRFREKRFELLIDPQNGFIDESIFLTGQVFDKEIHEVMCREMRAGDTFVDIGANIGVFTNFVPQIVGESGKIIAFEPIKRVYEQNLASVKQNGYKNVSLINMACSNVVGKSKIYFLDSNIGGSSMEGSAVDEKQISKSRFEEIQTVLGDDVLLKESRVDFIKIDVEGHEYAVLQGINKTVEKFRPKIILEFSPLFTPETTGKMIDMLAPFYTDVYIIELGVHIPNRKESISQYIDLKTGKQKNLFFYNKEQRS